MRRLFRRRLWCVVLAAALPFGPGCSATPRLSNGSVSVCFRALPVGRGAIHEKGAKLIGVHRVPVDAVRIHLPAPAQDQLARDDDTSVCAMAFKGTFRAGQVAMADPSATGAYAPRLVSSQLLHLLRPI